MPPLGSVPDGDTTLSPGTLPAMACNGDEVLPANMSLFFNEVTEVVSSRFSSEP